MSDSSPNITIFSGATSGTKWWIAISLGILFILFAARGTFNLTNKISTGIGGPALKRDYCYTTLGLIIHAILFALLIRLLLW
jgi:hypothetical protein